MSDLGDSLDLLAAARGGDAVAGNALFERHRERLLQVVSLLLGRRRGQLLEDEEDIVQETLLRAFRGLDSFTPQGEGSLLRWLARLAENAVADAVRRRRALKRGEDRVVVRTDLASVSLLTSVYPGSDPTPSQEAVGHELAERIEGLLLELPERERRAFTLRQLCGAPYEEVAEELGLGSAGSARAFCSRVLARVVARLPDLPGG